MLPPKTFYHILCTIKIKCGFRFRESCIHSTLGEKMQRCRHGKLPDKVAYYGPNRRLERFMGLGSSKEVGIGLNTGEKELRGWFRTRPHFDRFYISLKWYPTQEFMNFSNPCVLYKTAGLICCSWSFRYESQIKPRQISLDTVGGRWCV